MREVKKGAAEIVVLSLPALRATRVDTKTALDT